MSNYTKSTNFAAKDSLPSGNAGKVIKGTEINTEFDNIATAISTKADLNSPTLVTPNLGTPSAAVLTNATGLPLTSGVTGTLPVANGGTGASTFSSGALLKGAGTSAITTATSGTDYAPATTGTSAQLLANNGSGGFSNVTVGTNLTLSGGTLNASVSSASGSDTQVQFNDGGSFGGDAGLTYNKTTNTLSTDIVVFSSGSASAPSITATGDTNTGVFFPAADTIGVATAGSERMRIDSSGNVGIGVTPPTVSQGRLLSLAYSGSGISVTSGTSLDLTNNAYYNSGWKYGQSGKTARIQLSDDQIYFGNATTGTAGNAITFTQTLAIQQGKTLALEGASLQTGTGIAFPATQSASSDANTLDDYEEGTFTPTLTSSSGTITLNSSYNTLAYTKIGRVVVYTGELQVSSVSSPTGNAAISGFPFNFVNGTQTSQDGSSVISITNTSQATTFFQLAANAGFTSAYIWKADGSASATAFSGDEVVSVNLTVLI